jgi:carbon storage regulator CsrA
MLVLARDRGQGITIETKAGRIHVTVVAIKGDLVRLGFEADKGEAVILRDEVLERIKAGAEAGKLSELRDQMDLEENLR